MRFLIPALLLLSSCSLFKSKSVEPMVESHVAMKAIFDNQSEAFLRVIELAKRANADQAVIDQLLSGVNKNVEQYVTLHVKFLETASQFDAVNWRRLYEEASDVLRQIRSKK